MRGTPSPEESAIVIDIDELKNENRDLGELRDALAALVDHVGMDNQVVREMVDRFVGKVGAHLLHESRSIYTELLEHGDEHARQVAGQFLDNTHELNRIFAKYSKRWCRYCEEGGDADMVRDDTRAVMRLVDERIALENGRLFPLVAG
jgi:hypothetical protein